MRDQDGSDAIRAELNNAGTAQEYAFFADEAYTPIRKLQRMLEQIYGSTAIAYTRICAKPARQQRSPRFPLTPDDRKAMPRSGRPRRELWRIFEIRAVIGPLDATAADDYFDVAAGNSNPSPETEAMVIAHFESYYHGRTFGWELAGARLFTGESLAGDPIIREFLFRNYFRNGQYSTEMAMRPVPQVGYPGLDL